jgi:hypothetical protein
MGGMIDGVGSSGDGQTVAVQKLRKKSDNGASDSRCAGGENEKRQCNWGFDNGITKGYRRCRGV